MKWSQSVEDQLRSALQELSKDAVFARQSDPEDHELDQLTDTFDMHWQDRLNDFELGELRGCKRGCDVATKEAHVQQRMESYMRDSAALPVMTPEQQVAFWDGNRPSTNTNFWEQEQARVSELAYDTARQQIQERYSDLREGLSRAVDEIREGRDPSLDFLLESHTTREAERAGREEAVLGELNKRANERER